MRDFVLHIVLKHLLFSIFLILVLVPLQAQSWFGDNYKPIIRKGNLEYKKGDYDAAADAYNKSFEKKPDNPTAHFNLGNTLYKKGNYDSAMTHYQASLNGLKDENLKSRGYYNLGNSMLQKREFQKAIDAYKESLKSNPSNEDARYNLSYAKKMLQQQQQQQNKDDKKDQNKNDEQQKNQDDKKDQDKKEDQKQDEKQEQQKQENKPNQMTKEEAERILNALKNREKYLKDQQKEKGAKSSGVEKDW